MPGWCCRVGRCPWHAEDRGFALGLHHTGYPFGALLGGLATAGILSVTGVGGWRVAFLVTPMLGFLLVVALWAYAKPTTYREVDEYARAHGLTGPSAEAPERVPMREQWAAARRVMTKRVVVIRVIAGFLSTSRGKAGVPSGVRKIIGAGTDSRSPRPMSLAAAGGLTVWNVRRLRGLTDDGRIRAGERHQHVLRGARRRPSAGPAARRAGDHRLSFGTLLPMLAWNRRVIAVELQGHGHTADSDRPLTIENLAGDVVGLLDHLDVDRTDVYGFSLGGLVAFQLALSRPARADRLVLVSAQLLAGIGYEEIDPTQMPTEDDFREMREAYLKAAPAPGHFEEFEAKLSATISSFEYWPDDALRSITQPTLLVIGDHDFVRLDHAVRMHTLIPGARLAVLPGTTHMNMLRRTELLLPIIESFLPDTHDPRAS